MENIFSDRQKNNIPCFRMLTLCLQIKNARMTNAVEIENLSKDYGKLRALNKIMLNVPEGTIYGLAGPNGAGKTTLIKALVGALKPTAGSVKVLGLDPLRDKWKLRRQIGYMPQTPALYDDLSAKKEYHVFWWRTKSS